jgi:hypothetical protein
VNRLRMLVTTNDLGQQILHLGGLAVYLEAS